MVGEGFFGLCIGGLLVDACVGFGREAWLGMCSLSDCGSCVGLSGGAGAPPATGGHAFGVGRRGVRWMWDVVCASGACNRARAASDPKLALRVRGVRCAAGGMWFWGGLG
jgi:hypothetical protein